MSYDIVKSIGAKGDKFFISCASNNVFPRTYEREEWEAMSRMLQEKGREAVDLYIFKIFESGSFQGGNNKYTRALKVLYNVFGEEYSGFNWRNISSSSKEYDKRKSEEFDNLLLKALRYKLPKTKFIVVKPVYKDVEHYLKKITTKRGFWTGEPTQAKKFDFKQEAEQVKGMFRDNNFWTVQEVTK